MALFCNDNDDGNRDRDDDVEDDDNDDNDDVSNDVNDEVYCEKRLIISTSNFCSGDNDDCNDDGDDINDAFFDVDEGIKSWCSKDNKKYSNAFLNAALDICIEW